MRCDASGRGVELCKVLGSRKIADDSTQVHRDDVLARQRANFLKQPQEHRVREPSRSHLLPYLKQFLVNVSVSKGSHARIAPKRAKGNCQYSAADRGTSGLTRGYAASNQG